MMNLFKCFKRTFSPNLTKSFRTFTQSTTSNKNIFTPIKLGDLNLCNRIVMAAMTRLRADFGTGVPNELHQTYYSQRAKKTAFVLTECSQVSREGNSFPGLPAFTQMSRLTAGDVLLIRSMTSMEKYSFRSIIQGEQGTRLQTALSQLLLPQ